LDELIRALHELHFAVANIIAAAASRHTPASGVTERLVERAGAVAIGLDEDDVVGSEHVGFTRACTA